MVATERLDPVLGQAIRDARRALGLNQTELGLRVGVNQRRISRWEHGFPLYTGELAQLEAALELPTGTLLARARPPTGSGTEQAIVTDALLDDRTRFALLAQYRQAIREGPSRQRARQREAGGDGNGSGDA